LLIATNVCYHLSFIYKPILDNKPVQPWIVLLLAPMPFSAPVSIFRAGGNVVWAEVAECER
jgi:hypothetical protein